MLEVVAEAPCWLNSDGIREDVDDNDTRRDFLKEQALAHGFESGV